MIITSSPELVRPLHVGVNGPKIFHRVKGCNGMNAIFIVLGLFVVIGVPELPVLLNKSYMIR
jgi:hypothetical protein